jgi:hypothetical protein
MEELTFIGRFAFEENGFWIIDVYNEEKELIKTHQRQAEFANRAIKAADKIAGEYMKKGYGVYDIKGE